MTKKMNLLITLTFLVFGCAHTATISTETFEPSSTDESVKPASNMLGNISLKDVDGKNVSLSEYSAGKVALISFFATYCEPCKQKTVDHQALYDTFKDKGLVIIAISVDEPETSGQVRPFVKSRNITFPVLLDTDFEAVNQLNPRRALPYSMILDRNGKSVWTHEGYVPGDDKLIETHVAEAVAAAD